MTDPDLSEFRPEPIPRPGAVATVTVEVPAPAEVPAHSNRYDEPRFLADITGHTMTVAHDDGLYRHLRFRSPGPHGWLCWFDLITWPGNLTIRGDMGTYAFARTDDMLAFFRGQYINPSYWSEKVTASDRDGIKAYDQDVARAEVMRSLYEDHDGPPSPALLAAVLSEVLDEDSLGSEEELRSSLDSFRHGTFAFTDTWEWDLTSYTWQYLWCCHAILWGIGQYDAAKAAAA